MLVLLLLLLLLYQNVVCSTGGGGGGGCRCCIKWCNWCDWCKWWWVMHVHIVAIILIVDAHLQLMLMCIVVVAGMLHSVGVVATTIIITTITFVITSNIDVVVDIIHKCCSSGSCGGMILSGRIGFVFLCPL